jgi:hypothetical protein
MTIRQARALLSHTLGKSPEQINEAETLVLDLHARKPGRLQGGGLCVFSCEACGCAIWTLHSDGDDERWACNRCHREPMTDGRH